MQKRRLSLPRVALAAAAFGIFAGGPAARAQVASTPPTPASSGFTVSLTPYAWLPRITSTYSYTGPSGSTVTDTVSAGIGDYISKINFGLAFGGEIRYDRFSLMTDLVYSSLSLTTSNSHLSQVNLGGAAPASIPAETQLGTGTRLGTTIWSVAGGYTLLQGEWGNVDAVAGIRTLFLNSTTNATLEFNIFGPNNTIPLSRNGSLTLNAGEVEGIGGLTGRINIPGSSFYVPYYFDAGGGTVPFTWQAYAAVAYKAASWADVSLGYRYLEFSSGNKTKGVQKLEFGGAILAGNFRF